jgi:hypothetical protein
LSADVVMLGKSSLSADIALRTRSTKACAALCCRPAMLSMLCSHRRCIIAGCLRRSKTVQNVTSPPSTAVINGPASGVRAILYSLQEQMQVLQYRSERGECKKLFCPTPWCVLYFVPMTACVQTVADNVNDMHKDRLHRDPRSLNREIRAKIID